MSEGKICPFMTQTMHVERLDYDIDGMGLIKKVVQADCLKEKCALYVNTINELETEPHCGLIKP